MGHTSIFGMDLTSKLCKESVSMSSKASLGGYFQVSIYRINFVIKGNASAGSGWQSVLDGKESH